MDVLDLDLDWSQLSRPPTLQKSLQKDKKTERQRERETDKKANLKSSCLEKSSAEAWQTAFLFFGFSIIDFSQNVFVILSKPDFT
jgi:hypothetical protein